MQRRRAGRDFHMSTENPLDTDPTVLQERIAAIWQDVLRMPADRRDATFFDLQGQSVSAVRIAARIEDELGIVIDVGILFEDPDLDTFVSKVMADSTR